MTTRPIATLIGALFVFSLCATVTVQAKAPATDAALEAERDQALTATVAKPIARPTPVEPDVAFRRTAVVKRGDTLMKLLRRHKVDGNAATAVIRSLRPVYDLRRMRIGQPFTLMFGPHTEDKQAPRLVGLSFRPQVDREIAVAPVSVGSGTFRAITRDRPLARGDAYAHGRISSNLFDAAVNAELPIPVLMDLIRLFSFDVDFQREIQPGDAFEVMYDQLRDERGEVVRSDRIRYAAMILGGKRLEYFHHVPASGPAGYYDPTGQSVRKTLMRTPVDGARLSSGFGRRRHPISGYNRMHRGVDFAASRGTPVMAAGDGVIERIGRWNAYGNYIRIRHNATYKTAYAHLRGYAKTMRRGRRVKQGEIIGYVGSTGRSTGPHLHYEVLVNGRQTNPMRVKLPAGESLRGTALKRFQAELPTIESRIAGFRDLTRLASD